MKPSERIFLGNIILIITLGACLSGAIIAYCARSSQQATGGIFLALVSASLTAYGWKCKRDWIAAHQDEIANEPHDEE